VHGDRDPLRAICAQPRRDILIAGLIRECAQQLEHLGDGRMGRDGDLLHRMEFEPLGQCVAIQRRPVHGQASILHAQPHALDLEEPGQRAELRLLFLFRSGIAKQVQSAREQRGEFLRAGHGEAQSIEYAS